MTGHPRRIVLALTNGYNAGLAEGKAMAEWLGGSGKEQIGQYRRTPSL